MVQEGDFLFELVDAETKLPFKEHVKDDKVYVEVEPDAEYFIKLRKVGSTGFGTSSGKIVCEFHVDGKSLGYQRTYSDRDPSTCEDYFDGIFERRNGCDHITALKFMKAQVIDEKDGATTGGRTLMMGKVEVFIYEGIFDKMRENTKLSDFASPFTATGLAPGQDGDDFKKKNIRSARGSVSNSHTIAGSHPSYRQGRHLDIISLNYCAAVGLIHVGVLPMPDVYTHFKIKQAYEGKKRDNPDPLKIQPKRIRTVGDATADLFDLVDDE